MRLMLSLACITVSMATSAAVIDFEDVPHELLGQYVTAASSGGFDFVGSGAPNPIVVDSSGFESNPTTNLLFCPGCTLVMSAANGTPFDLLSLDELVLNTGVLVTGTYAGGGSVQATLASDSEFIFETVSFGTNWSGLASATFSTDGSGLGTVLDNIQVNVVPIPAAVWLFASGLGLLGWLRTRKI